MAAAGVLVTAARPETPAEFAARARRPPSARPAPLPSLFVLLAAAAGPGAGGATGLYRAGEDAVWVLDSGSVREATANSSAAWLVQFYSSWCGHCIGYAPTWRALAADVRDWAAAIRVAALDCAEERNHEVCQAYGIHFYPSFRYFKAFTKDFTTGENFKGPDRELQTVRQAMIDFLQNHTDANWPPACPALGPIGPRDFLSFTDVRDTHYVAIIFESSGSYVGREVALDLIPYEKVTVKRALDEDQAFLEKLGVSSLPSCYLIYPNGSRGLINMSKLYTADLESGLHYLLRVELASHRTLAGMELKTLKNFVTVVAKLFPGRPPIRRLLEMLQEGLASLPLDRIPYKAVLDLVNNKMRLFHTLTVQAATNPEALDATGFEGDPQAVLQTIRQYVHIFFGCRECGEHFEEMARESLGSVKSLDQAVLWLWEKHNLVNGRLAGHLSEDPRFPKVPWPTPDLCPACHEETKGLDSWNEGQVLLFLKHHYSPGNLVHMHAAAVGGAGEAPEQEQGHSTPEQPSDRGAQSPRAPHVLSPITGLSERAHLGQDGAAGHRKAEAAVPFLGIGFSSLDMSLCVLLYVASSLFLMFMFFFFRVRARRWKVRHYYPAV